MKTLNHRQFFKRLGDSWAKHEADQNYDFLEPFFDVIGGKHLKTVHLNEPDESNPHDVFLIAIKDPEYIISDAQLCQIQDEGNHCISKGSITYEYPYAYITWSNLGHI